MASLDNRTWCFVLTTVLLVFVGDCHGRLRLKLELKEDSIFCGHLNCWHTGTSDKVVYNITSISLYDISQPEVKTELATVKSDGEGIKINPNKTGEVAGAGCINRNDADLSVNLMKKQDCQSGSFLCELGYIDVEGRREKMTIRHTRSDNVSTNGQCDCKLDSACPRGWKENKGWCYAFNEEAMSWPLAQATCQIYKARLVVVDNAEKNEWISTQMKTANIQAIWTAGTSRYHRANWEWAQTNRCFIGCYQNWAPGEPSNPNGEQCLEIHILNKYKWNDLNCMWNRTSLCEKPVQTQAIDTVDFV